MSERRHSDLELYRRLLVQARPYWPHIAGLLVLGLLATPLALLTPLPLKIVIDHVAADHAVSGFLAWALPDALTGSPGAMLATAVGLVLLIALLNQARNLATAWLDTWTGERLVLEFRARLFDRIQRLSLVYHDTEGTYDSIYRVLYDAPAIQWIAIHGVLPFVSAGATLVGMIWVTAAIDAQLALVALAVSPVLLIATLAWRPRLRRQWTEAKNLESAAASVVQETLGAVRVVKAFGQEERESERFVDHAREGVRARTRAMVSENVYGTVVALIVAAGTALVLWIGARHVLAGTLTLGSLILIMGYLAQLYAPLQTLGGTVATVQSSLASADRAFALLDREPDVTEREDAIAIDRASGDLEVEGVTFGYVPGRPVLEDVDVSIERGAWVGIAGPTGAGKTTLVSLLVRFYDPDEGRILLDGRDLRDYRLADLRRQFGFALQEPILFSTTIAENIAYARPQASRDEIEAAARAANAHDFIAALPDGYESVVGERGMTLSGGERQRVSLARAFLKDAPVLILDEPTSSVDTDTEALIVEAMGRLMRGRTTLMIAHRPTTMRDCDVLLTIRDGRLVAVDRRDGALREALW